MTKFTNNITIVHILDKLTASHAMQQRVINNKDINILYQSTVTQIHGNNNHVTGVTITNQQTRQSYDLPTHAVFIAIGLTPNTSIFKGQLDLDSYGYIIVNNHTKTSIEGIFAAGDVHDNRYRQAIVSAGAGCMAALDAERFLHQ
jgi:thioredoxin reductase (NADPH)